MTKTKRTCIFCGATPTSREHLIPQWVRTALVEDPRGVDASEHWQYLEGRLERWWSNSKRPSFVASHMCVSCNTGWMAEIERAANPPVSALIKGEQPSRLDAADQVAIAKWLGLKAVVERYIASPPRYIDPQWVAHFANTHEPPPTWQIRIGRYQGNFPFYLASRIGTWTLFPPIAATAIQENGLLTMLGVGFFAAQIIGTSWPVPVVADPDLLVQIWPQPPSTAVGVDSLRPSAAKWPPRLWIDDRDLVTLSETPGGSA